MGYWGGSQTKSKSSKKKSGGGIGGFIKHGLPGSGGGIEGVGKFAKGFLRGGEKAAMGLPTSSLALVTALGKASAGHPKPLLNIGKETVKGTAHTVKHPGEDPFQTSLLLLSLLSGGVGGATRLGAGASAARAGGGLREALGATVKRPTYTRRYKGLPRTVEGKSYQKEVYTPLDKRGRKRPIGKRSPKKWENEEGKKYRTPDTQYTPIYTRPAARSPLSRGIGDIHEALYEASRKRAINEKRGGFYARTKDKKYAREDKRIKAQAERGIESSIEDLQPAVASATNSTIDRRIPAALTLPTALMRLAMVTRPRYAVQNALQTGAYLAADQGPVGLARSVRKGRQLRREAPEIPKYVRGAMGSTGPAAAAIEHQGFLQRPTARMAQIMGGVEGRMREAAFYKAARDRGVDTPQQYRRLFAELGQKYADVAHTANQAAVDYSRLGPNERFAMATGIPIFYPMFKNTSMWAGKYPFEHPLQASIFSQLGQQGFEQQAEDFPGGLPVWSPYLVRSSDTETLNPANVLPYGPLSDLMRQGAGALRPGGPQSELLSLLQQVSPAVETAYLAPSGRSFESGWEDPYVKGGGSGLFAALRSYGQFVPGMDLINPRDTKAFGVPDWKDRALMFLLGQWATPRTTDFDALEEQAKRTAHDPDDPMSFEEEIRSLLGDALTPWRSPKEKKSKKKTPAKSGGYWGSR